MITDHIFLSMIWITVNNWHSENTCWRLILISITFTTLLATGPFFQLVQYSFWMILIFLNYLLLYMYFKICIQKVTYRCIKIRFMCWDIAAFYVLNLRLHVKKKKKNSELVFQIKNSVGIKSYCMYLYLKKQVKHLQICLTDNQCI